MKTTFASIRLPVGLALAMAGTAYGQFTPAPLTPETFTQDIVVERTATTPLINGGVTTASMDGGIANNGDTWNEQGYFSSDTTVGLPPAGSTVVTNNHTFKFAPSYTANNAIMLDAGYFTNANFVLSTPGSYVGLSFLTSGGNGGCQFRWTATRQDGSTATGTAASPDWFNVAQNIGWIANGRVNAQSYTLDNYNSQNPRLYYVDVAVPASASPITSISIQYVSGNASGHSAIMAISGQSTAGGAFAPLSGTGYNADIVVEASAPKRWNLENVTASTSATMDAGQSNTGNTWFEQGYYSRSNTFGLPAAGSTFTAQNATDHQFTLAASYTSPNAVLLDVNNPTATLTLATPRAFTGLSFLTASGNGSFNLLATVRHQDGTTEDHIFRSPDWFGNPNIAVNANGRINVDSGVFDSLNSGNPRLYFSDVLLGNTTSPVTSVDLSFTNTTGRSAVFGVSGATGAIRPVLVSAPVDLKVNSGGSGQLTVSAEGTAPLSYQWQRGTNGTFVNLSNGGAISGSGTATLSVNNVTGADEAAYRVIVSNAAGSATSAVAQVVVLSALQDVTAPGDSITSFGGGSPAAEGVEHAIDNNTSKYLNSGSGGTPIPPTGFVVTPAAGRTVVSALRFYTANDAPERDPSAYTLEGSNDAGATWSMISSNSLALPDARNAGGAALDPLTQALQQVRFTNTRGYSTYRLTFRGNKGNVNLMQIGEVEFLGVADTSGFPAITLQPQSSTIFAGSPAQFTVTATGTPGVTYQWRVNTNGTYVSIPGATTATLALNNPAASQAGLYQVVVSNSVGVLASAPATLRILSTANNVLQPADTITSFGDESGAFWGDNTNAFRLLDQTGTKWVNGGSGFSAAAGFPPFAGPVGVVITPSAPTVVTGLRLFTAEGNTERDPTDYTLEGSVDNGVTWHTLSAGPLDLPLTRNAADSALDPLTSGMQEISIANSAAYSSYRLTFNDTRNNNVANSIQLAEIQLLGSTAPAVSAQLTITRQPNGSLVLTTSKPGTLQSTTNLQPNGTTWQDEGAITGSRTVTPGTEQSKFYRVVTQ